MEKFKCLGPFRDAHPYPNEYILDGGRLVCAGYNPLTGTCGVWNEMSQPDLRVTAASLGVSTVESEDHMIYPLCPIILQLATNPTRVIEGGKLQIIRSDNP